MERHVRLSELLIGTEGLALLRTLYDGSDEQAAARLGEVRAILDGDDAGETAELTVESDPRAGYGVWAASYDDPGNPIVALEQPAVWGLIDRLAPRRALDAACGTGRHAARLNALGHQVDGIDLTPEMLATARVNVPGASFREADLRSIPAPDASYDLVVCGLALAHLPELGGAVSELSRVLAPGGRLIVSVLHPFLAALGWQAPFSGADGQPRVRSRVPAHARGLRDRARSRRADTRAVDRAPADRGAHARQATGEPRDPGCDRRGVRGTAGGARPRGGEDVAPAEHAGGCRFWVRSVRCRDEGS